MAVQAEKLAGALEQHGWHVQRVAVNQPMGRATAWAAGIPFVRTAVRTVLFLRALDRALNHCETVYLLSGFFGYFFWVSAPAILLARARRKRIFLSARGGEAGRFFQRYRALVRPFVRLLDGVTAPSGFLQREFNHAFHLPVRIVPNIADLNQFRFRDRLPLRPRLVCPRNLEAMYNVGCVVRAFALVKRAFPEARLGIAGDGPERPGLERLCRELGIAEAVSFLGQVPHDRMQDVYESYDILVNSSSVDNTPGVILEAFAAGLPVVSTSTGGIPFLIQHNVNGLLVEKDNERQLADAVIQLLNDPPLAVRLAAEGWNRCRDWSRENVVRELADFLEPRRPAAERGSSLPARTQ